MPSPTWLHCNACGNEYNSKDKFYLLNCQHILCIGCLRKTGDGKKCPIDNNMVERIELQKLPNKLKSLFEPIDDVFKKLVKSMMFQQQQQSSLIKFGRGYAEKCKRAAQEVAKIRQCVAVKKAEHAKTRDRRIKMQIKLKEIYENNQKKSPSMLHRNSGAMTTPSTVASSMSPASSMFSTPSIVRPIYGFSPSSGTSSVRTTTRFFNHNGPFMKKVQDYSAIYTQKGSQKSHSSRKPFFA